MQEKTLTATLIPLIVAILSASTLLFGYIYQRDKEREIEMNKTRQEIYVRLTKNLQQKLEMFRRLKEDPELPKTIDQTTIDEVDQLIRRKYPELNQAFNESLEINSIMALYGDDEAVKACGRFYRDSYASLQPGSQIKPDKDKLILELRKSIFPSTTVNTEDVWALTTK